MARVFLPTVRASGIAVMYSVDQAVGFGGANRRDDVLLVQFFLLIARDSDARGNQGFTPPGQQTIKTDGVFGPETAAYIKFFQEDTDRRVSVGGVFVADGRIDPLDGKLRGSQRGGLLTMASLNFEYLNRQGTGFHSNISIDPRFPIGLKKSLFIS